MQPVRIHYLQHVPFEGLGCIEEWASQKGHSITSTKFYEAYKLPAQSSFDWLIIMGGPMGVEEQQKYEWLSKERFFIKQAIEHQKTVIGICLGSQLIASALGAKVYPNKEKEIGWFPIWLSSDQFNPLLNAEKELMVFHWHGDTFDIPKNAVNIASSEVCLNQAFTYSEKVIGLQFHLEVTVKTLKQMIDFGNSELIKGKYIQSSEMILNKISLIQDNNQRMYQLLNYLELK